jgi:hypothetical protein
VFVKEKREARVEVAVAAAAWKTKCSVAGGCGGTALAT